mmetsp:Transcript_54434/g.48992  ORF Transcript_54434/g.48992 Transcript_54434/m.48992 type:complete len:101 (+) Transcript_54434:135-437(+)
MSSPQIQTQSNKLAKNVSAVIFTRPAALLVTRIGTTNWRRYPSTFQNRGFRSVSNRKFVRTVNSANQKYSKQNFGSKQWKSENYGNFSYQMQLALRGYYH